VLGDVLRVFQRTAIAEISGSGRSDTWTLLLPRFRLWELAVSISADCVPAVRIPKLTASAAQNLATYQRARTG
jgi:hypothetical protein